MMDMRTNWDIEHGEPMSKWVQIHAVTFNKFRKRLILFTDNLVLSTG